MKKSFFYFATLSEAPLLIQLFIGAVSVIFTLFITFLISQNEIKPKWLKYSIYASLYLALGAFFESWNEKRIFAAWAENFISLLFRYGGLVFAIACGYFVGMKITKKTSRLYETMFSNRIYFRKGTYLPTELLGWVVGIAIGILIIFIILAVGHNLPGVGWRLSKDYE